MNSVVLDSEGFAALADSSSRLHGEVVALLRAAQRLGRSVLVPAVVLAELYRGRGRSALMDACLSRETGIEVRSTDRRLARLVGGVLVGAGAGSEAIVDAHVVATAVERGGGVLVTSDPDDLERLAAAYAGMTVVHLA